MCFGLFESILTSFHSCFWEIARHPLQNTKDNPLEKIVLKSFQNKFQTISKINHIIILSLPAKSIILNQNLTQWKKKESRFWITSAYLPVFS